MKVLYTAVATAVGGRDGHAESSDGQLSVRLAIQRELGGSGAGTNPEQLFACGYAACFGSTIDFVAQRDRGPRPERIEVTAQVSLGPSDGGGYALAATLGVRLAGVDRTRAEELAEAAHRVCPYSNATRGNMPVTISVMD